MIWKSLTWRIWDICWCGLFEHIQHLRQIRFIVAFVGRDSMRRARAFAQLGKDLDELLPKVAPHLKIEIGEWKGCKFVQTDPYGDWWSGGVVSVPTKRKEN